jgi:acetylglutamate kinase
MSESKHEFSRVILKFAIIPAEFHHYHGIFSTIPSHQLAFLKVSGSCIENPVSLEKIAEDIGDMHSVGFNPTINHGWGKILTQRLEKLRIPNRNVESTGDRYTDARIMEHVEIVAKEAITRLNDAINRFGAETRMISPDEGLIIAQDKTDPDFGSHNGDIVKVNTELIIEAHNQGVIPIFSPIGISRDGKKHYNLNAATVTSWFVRALNTEKHILITGTDGILDKDKKTIQSIVLNRDYERLVRTGIVSGGQLTNLNEVKLTLESRANGEDKSAQIVSPGDLPIELYTRKGGDKSTFIRRGYDISAEPIDLYRRRAQETRALIENAFGTRLKTGFFDEFKTVYIERRNKGVAFVIPNVVGIGDYLDLIAVDCELKRKGLSTDLFSAIKAHQPNGGGVLFWRSQISRPITKYYLEICTGHERYTGNDGIDYNCFWIAKEGLVGSGKATKAIEYVKNRPSNFEK